MATKKKSAGKKKVVVNFEGVEGGMSGSFNLPDGHYEVEIVEVETREGNEADYLNWKFKVLSGPKKGTTFYDITSLTPKALFRLRTLLEALGADVSDDDFELVLDEYPGEKLIVEIVNEKYQGKDRPRVANYSNIENGLPEESDDDEEEESDDEGEDADDESEESDDDSEESESDDDESESDDSESEEEESEDDDSESDDDDDDEDENDDEDDEPEAKPAKGKAATKKTAAKKSAEKSEPTVAVGAKVKFVDAKGKINRGKVKSVKGDTATVDVNGKDIKVPVDELTIV